MRKNIGVNTYFYPLPVALVGTFDRNNNPNIMNAAWAGIHDTNEVFICLSSDHKTTTNIKENNEFTIAFATKGTIDISDYVGLVSGNDIDKVKELKLEYVKSDFVNAPIFLIYPLSLDLKVKELKEENDTTYIVASIVNINCEDKYLINDIPNIKDMHLISFIPGLNKYYEIKDELADAFNIGTKYLKK